jgi:FtsH-binding integral membrane protein
MTKFNKWSGIVVCIINILVFTFLPGANPRWAIVALFCLMCNLYIACNTSNK